MRKNTLLLLAFLCFCFVNAQDDDANDAPDKHELKLNATNLIIFSYLDGAYEYLINEESSFGVNLLYSLSDDEVLDEYRTFSITPYYRQYFSKKYAKGFFIEGFGMLNSGEDIFIATFDENGAISGDEENYTDFALGISVGGKFVTPRGFVVDLYLGIGRNLFNSDFAPELVGRGGVTLGYRF
ncbi:hypothetical protein MTsPCn5_21880 [Croceitalea sp. MTPC5]|uniref:DUF3575 domain-containing protein n=1 Tax=Croceitalea sp. MTPC5 TaxID=3056565 RepID=UPI002B3E6D33|nr:hypothetical protein MTsPCn5_21880 [Croceitalea sp. MTPC5]